MNHHKDSSWTSHNSLTTRRGLFLASESEFDDYINSQQKRWKTSRCATHHAWVRPYPNRDAQFARVCTTLPQRLPLGLILNLFSPTEYTYIYVFTIHEYTGVSMQANIHDTRHLCTTARHLRPCHKIKPCAPDLDSDRFQIPSPPELNMVVRHLPLHAKLIMWFTRSWFSSIMIRGWLFGIFTFPAAEGGWIQ